MVELGMAGFLVGYLLGLRFRVLVLLPLEMVAFAAAIFVAVSGQAGWVPAMLGFLSFCVSAQVSYALSLALPLRSPLPVA